MPIGRTIRKYLSEPVKRRYAGLKEWATKRKLGFYAALGSRESSEKLRILKEVEAKWGEFRVDPDIINSSPEILRSHLEMRKNVLEALNEYINNAKSPKHRMVAVQLQKLIKEDPYAHYTIANILNSMVNEDVRKELLEAANKLENAEWSPGLRLTVAGKIFHALGRGPSDLIVAEDMRQFFRAVGASVLESSRLAKLSVENKDVAEAYARIASTLHPLAHRSVEFRNAIMNPRTASALVEIMAHVTEKVYKEQPKEEKAAERKAIMTTGEIVGKYLRSKEKEEIRKEIEKVLEAKSAPKRSSLKGETGEEKKPTTTTGEIVGEYLSRKGKEEIRRAVKEALAEIMGANTAPRRKKALRKVPLSEYVLMRRILADMRNDPEIARLLEERAMRATGTIFGKRDEREAKMQPLEEAVARSLDKMFRRVEQEIGEERAMAAAGVLFGKRDERISRPKQREESLARSLDKMFARLENEMGEEQAMRAAGVIFGRLDTEYVKERKKELLGQLARLMYRSGYLVNYSTEDTAERGEIQLMKKYIREGGLYNAVLRRFNAFNRRMPAVVPGSDIPGTRIRRKEIEERAKRILEEIRKLEELEKILKK